MNLYYVMAVAVICSILITPNTATAQQNEHLINLLIKKNVISKQEADSIRADQALKLQAQKEKENQHGITIGSKALQISGLIQARYQGFQQRSINNAFDLHRARLDVKGDISDRWSYELYTEFAGTVKLLDGYALYKAGDFLHITAGQFKVPFSLESLIADSQLEFIDRSQVVDALSGRAKDVIGNQNGRDIGLQVNGGFAKLEDFYLFEYTLGVFNGAGFGAATDNNNHKDFAGRLSIHPLKNLSLSADLYDGKGFYGTPAASQTRNREGIDARYTQGPLSITTEYDKGKDGAIKRDGWYAQATYFIIPKRLQLAAKYDTYYPNNVVTTDHSNWYVGGVNCYFNDWVRILLNYSYRREQTKQINNDLFSAQLQLTF